MNRSLRACALYRLARGSSGDYRALESIGEFEAPSTLLCKNDGRRRGQRTYLRYKTNVTIETLHESKESK